MQRSRRGGLVGLVVWAAIAGTRPTAGAEGFLGLLLPEDGASPERQAAIEMPASPAPLPGGPAVAPDGREGAAPPNYWVLRSGPVGARRVSRSAATPGVSEDRGSATYSYGWFGAARRRTVQLEPANRNVRSVLWFP